MNVSERVALTERLARSIAWRALTEVDREAARAQASELVDELEGSYRESIAVGWIFVDGEPEPEDAG